MNPILFVDLLEQSNYKTSMLLSVMHKQRTYFSKKYSKINRQTLSDHTFNNKVAINLEDICEKQNVKLLKYVCDRITCDHVDVQRAIEKNVKNNNMKNVILLLNKYCNNIMMIGAVLRMNAKYGHVNIIKYLIKRGADVHEYDNEALQTSFMYNHLDVAKVLVNNGADVNTNMGFPLRICVRRGWIEMIKYFVEQCGADVINCGWNCDINDAVTNGHEKIVMYLLNKGIDAKVISREALWHCIKKGYIDMAKNLIKQAGVDIIISDDIIIMDNMVINIGDLKKYIYTGGHVCKI